MIVDIETCYKEIPIEHLCKESQVAVNCLKKIVSFINKLKIVIFGNHSGIRVNKHFQVFNYRKIIVFLLYLRPYWTASTIKYACCWVLFLV